MAHPYQEFEGTRLWTALDAELHALERNQDVTLTTARWLVIGSLCKRLESEGLIPCRQGDAPAA